MPAGQRRIVFQHGGNAIVSNWMREPTRNSVVLVYGSAALAVAGLAWDVYWVPKGFTCGIPYFVAVLLSFRTGRPRVTVVVAAVGSVLALGPLVLHSETTLPIVLDYIVVLFTIWMAAALCLRWMNAQTVNRRTEWFHQSIIDALASQIAVLDASGRVVAVNEAWRLAAKAEDAPFVGCDVGDDFLKTCRISSEVEAEEGFELAVGIREVLEKKRSFLSIEYLASSHGHKCWYAVRVTRFEDGDTDWAVIEQEDITRRKLADIALERSRANYRELAKRDELTGTYNRRALDEMMADELNRHQRYGNTLSFIMLDIDLFKVVNDTHGHPAGDAVIQWLASILRQNVRVVDHVARYGGEEFAIIVPELSGGEAFGMAERLRTLVAAHPMPYHSPSGETVNIPVTVSFGVASVPGDVDDVSLVIAAADKALYAAKRCGRNCTVIFRELEERLVG